MDIPVDERWRAIVLAQTRDDVIHTGVFREVGSELFQYTYLPEVESLLRFR